MPQARDSMETVHLTIELLHRIPRQSKVTAPELKRQLAGVGYGRDMRSIQRQLKQITEHFDVECEDRSKPYGYRWKQCAKGLPLPSMNQQESLLLTLAEQHLLNLIPSWLVASKDVYFRQASRNLPQPGNAQLGREWLSKVFVVIDSQSLLSPSIDSEESAQISHARYHNHWLKVVYLSASGKQIEAHYNSMGLAHQGVHLYVICRFENFHNDGSLALHRFVKVKSSSRSFSPLAEFDLIQYANDGRFGFGDDERVQISFCISKVAGFHLTETPLAQDQQVEELDDHYRITATVVDSAMLDRWLLGFGSDVSGVEKIRVAVN